MKVPVLAAPRDASLVHDYDARALRLAGYDPMLFEVSRIWDLAAVARTHFYSSSPVIIWGISRAPAKWSLLPPIIRNPFVLVAEGRSLPRGRWVHRAFRACEAVVFPAPDLFARAARRGLPMPQRWAISPFDTELEARAGMWIRLLPEVIRRARRLG